jgi:hypothetical protein
MGIGGVRRGEGAPQALPPPRRALSANGERVRRTATAIVTGGARRIGAALARALAEDGWHLLIHCRRSVAEAEALAAELGNAAIVAADLADPEADAIMAALKAAAGAAAGQQRLALRNMTAPTTSRRRAGTRTSPPICAPRLCSREPSPRSPRRPPRSSTCSTPSSPAEPRFLQLHRLQVRPRRLDRAPRPRLGRPRHQGLRHRAVGHFGLRAAEPRQFRLRSTISTRSAAGCGSRRSSRALRFILATPT